MKVQLHQHESVVRCVVCHAADGELRTCVGCGATTHLDCRPPDTRCPTLGCNAPNPAGPGEAYVPRVVLIAPPGAHAQVDAKASEAVRPKPKVSCLGLLLLGVLAFFLLPIIFSAIGAVLPFLIPVIIVAVIAKFVIA